MRNGLQKPVRELFVTLLLVVVAAALWAAWLGWDQERDVHPDGSTTGPYEAWQVIGLVLTLLVPVYWAASRQYVTAAVLGTSLGLAVAAFYDWSDDGSGLFVIGVGMVLIGSLVVTCGLSLLIASWKREAGPRRLP
ncbi:hypothetical protein ACWGHM_27235 [Streptomyces sp. NPDC054904]|uniref:hypothetical protein n=1 Tax=unclassified Streptomyces TaxID=2593676 RepID=UPI002481D891|nr:MULTISPECIES: hypothetical protein [unclassified Streptomyces]MDA5279402.1 hypothetical protein [Streptomyces sp. Isolate_45]MDX2394872.1 hypothetical protein [Streptomyces sp. DK15]